MGRRLAYAVAVAGLASALAACGSSSNGKRTTTASSAAQPPTRTLPLAWAVHLKTGPAVLTVDGIAADAHGRVFVGDAAGNRVQELSSDGRLVRTLDGRAAVHGGFEFIKPGESTADAQAIASIGLDPHGALYVADTGHYLIEKFGPSGRFLGSWGGNGFKPGQFGDVRLVGVALDGTGHVYATDDLAGSYTVQKYSSAGAYIARFGPKDNKPGDPTPGAGSAAITGTCSRPTPAAAGSRSSHRAGASSRPMWGTARAPSRTPLRWRWTRAERSTSTTRTARSCSS
jgi:hypothetical protein